MKFLFFKNYFWNQLNFTMYPKDTTKCMNIMLNFHIIYFIFKTVSMDLAFYFCLAKKPFQLY